jgi:hypothetical protein
MSMNLKTVVHLPQRREDAKETKDSDAMITHPRVGHPNHGNRLFLLCVLCAFAVQEFFEHE